MPSYPRCLVAIAIILLLAWPASSAEDEAPPVDPQLLQALKWRLIGPFRGGRSTAVTGVRGKPLTYYFGATGGGLWKTEDAGTTWKNVSDGHFKTGSVGAIAVAESDPNVVWAGMGEADVRGVTTSSGDGVYKSTDAGHTWTHMGLERTRQISAIRIHPDNPNMVYVAAQGNPWTPNAERGVYRSIDGGLTWRLVYFVNDRTGASDLAMDAKNPRILYAAFWEHQRLPWKVVSGGEGSGVYKSTDGGDSWTRLEKGLPELMGKIGIAVSPSKPARVWAIVEADEGGLFRSDDAGKTWKRINDQRVLRARSWYYTKVTADPRDPENVYVMNAPFLSSQDGGRTFARIPTPHGDNHLLWIDPDDPARMINANDGGANVSWSFGETWSTQTNQPTAQFYRVITDDRFPYYVYGGQQDNSAVAIASRSQNRGIGREDWYEIGGCESAHIAFDPKAAELVYAGCYQGLIDEYEVSTGRRRDIMAYPYLGLGSEPRDLKYRFNWNAPIVASPHDPKVIYHAGNVVLRTRDRGNTWEVISPDLTRDEDDKQGPGGEPITNEAAGAETYNTIFYFVESPHEAGTFWAGTDDGLVHLSRDDGVTWTNVTPEGMGEAQVNAIEVSPHDPAKAWLALTRYKYGDFSPHVYKTEDYGTTWSHLVDGIDEEAFVRVVREDPGRVGLLYAGTEIGLYVSFDDGLRWQPFQNNLPVVAITDLTIRHHDLVAATQGRAFWILDDLTPLHQITDEVAAREVFLFSPRNAYRIDWPGGEATPGRGANPPSGAILYYYLAESAFEDLTAQAEETVEDVRPAAATSPEDADAGGGEKIATLEILDGLGQVIRSYSSREEDGKDGKDGEGKEDLGFSKRRVLPAEVGLNRFAWDMRREQVSQVPELLVAGAKTYRVAPGTYRARLTVGSHIVEKSFELLPDPRTAAAAEDFAEQQALLSAIWERADGIHAAVRRMRDVRVQVEGLIERTAASAGSGQSEIREAGEVLVEAIGVWEEQVVQVKQKTFQDVINFPNRLNAQLLALLESVDGSDPPVTAGARERFADLDARWQGFEAEMRSLLVEDLEVFNELFRVHSVPAVIVPPD